MAAKTGLVFSTKVKTLCSLAVKPKLRAACEIQHDIVFCRSESVCTIQEAHIQLQNLKYIVNNPINSIMLVRKSKMAIILAVSENN